MTKEKEKILKTKQKIPKTCVISQKLWKLTPQKTREDRVQTLLIFLNTTYKAVKKKKSMLH